MKEIYLTQGIFNSFQLKEHPNENPAKTFNSLEEMIAGLKPYIDTKRKINVILEFDKDSYELISDDIIDRYPNDKYPNYDVFNKSQKLK
jgi:hypothetical protein